MLISNSVFKKILPERMHLRWDTWANANSGTLLMSTLLGSSTLLVNTTSTTEKSLLALGVLAINLSLLKVGRNNDNRLSTLPQPWQIACTQVEAKLSKVMHQPSLYRKDALADLSMVLRDIHVDNMVQDNRNDDEIYAFEVGSHMPSRGGPESNPQMTSDGLDIIHKSLGFKDEDVLNWVEAAYLIAIHKRSTQKLPTPDQPLPGTTKAIAQIANSNPACLAYYVSEYGIEEHTYDNLWEDETGMGWFEQTKWPAFMGALRSMGDSMGLMTMYHHAAESTKGHELSKNQEASLELVQGRPSFG